MIIGLGDQDAREQGPHQGREAGGGCREAGDDHHEQARREEQLRALGPRRLREQPGKEQAAEDEHRGDDRRADQQGPDQAVEAARLRIRRKRAQSEDDRHDRQILEEQHGERRAADRARRADQREDERGR
jgi:hypothetical protein